MASRSGARALSVGVAPGCARHVMRRRKRQRRHGLGLGSWPGRSGSACQPADAVSSRRGRSGGCAVPASTAVRARPGPGPTALPPGRPHLERCRAAPALWLPFCSPRWARSRAWSPARFLGVSADPAGAARPRAALPEPRGLLPCFSPRGPGALRCSARVAAWFQTVKYFPPSFCSVEMAPAVPRARPGPSETSQWRRMHRGGSRAAAEPSAYSAAV
ncbi:uncharacterized protein LOC119154512 isoform X2 [Falco rusticolus]|uniref:uncharacterized protein LOC119154512 isoform X2 n=1 Tax=Falco rusticolus TaxID=120794 RepID=UPI00188669D9|nr:uncharacterized protein LOC119154512 isoform X2 [Falco rusticolus]